MLTIHKNSRVEQAGSRVQWFRLPGLDITLTIWEGRPKVFVFVHNAEFPLDTSGPEKAEPYELIVQRADA